MVDIRVVEALQHVAGKLLQLVHRQVERLHQLVELHLMEVLADHLMVAGIANDVHAAQEGYGRENGMRTVEEGHLTLMVGLLGGHEQHMQSGLVGRELVGHLLRGLDHPQVEVLGLYDEIVAIADLLLDLCDLLTREARNDTVDEGGIHAAGLFEPGLEVFAKVPELDILIDTVLQHMTVQEDQLTGEDDEALASVATERLVTTVQQLNQFAGIATGRCIVDLTAGIEGDTGLGGIGNHEAYLRLGGQCHEGGMLGIGVQRTTDDVDALQCVHGLTILTPLQVHVVQTVLTIEHVCHTLLDGLYDDDTSVEVSLLVHIPDNPIDEGPEEVSFSELNHLLRHHTLRGKLFV